MQSSYDVVIIGGGHNGLVAAGYLGMAGLRVAVFEKNPHVGGASVSERIFPEYDARLSKYSYLVSLLPQKIIRDLRLAITLRQRRIASYTPFHQPQPGSLLVSNESEAVTRASVEALAGHSREYAGYRQWQHLVHLFAQKVHHSLLQPLRRRDDWRSQFTTGDEKTAWRALVEAPLGIAIERYLQTDILRGVVFTDAKIGAFTHLHDECLLQNRTFLYHIIGNGTGEWRVPVGGMQSLITSLTDCAKKYGVALFTDSPATQIIPGTNTHTVVVGQDDQTHEVRAKYVLVNAAPDVLAKLLGNPPASLPEDEGSVFKINLLLKKLPALKQSNVAPEDAFAGTFHINQSYEQMQRSYIQAAAGQLPNLLPAEVYCHTLTDSSILAPELAKRGFHTLTLFGLDVPVV